MIGEDAGQDPGPALDPDPTRQVIGIGEEEKEEIVTEETGTEVEAIATGIDEEIVLDVETAKAVAGTVDAMIAEGTMKLLETKVLKGMVAITKNRKVQEDRTVAKKARRAKKSLITSQILKSRKNKPR